MGTRPSRDAEALLDELMLAAENVDFEAAFRDAFDAVYEVDRIGDPSDSAEASVSRPCA